MISTTGYRFARKLCKVLKLRPDQVTSLSIDVSVDQVTLTVTRLLNDTEAEAITALMTEFDLVERVAPTSDNILGAV